MAYMDPFTRIVTLTKRNHRYYGPTESRKIVGQLTEVATDLGTIYYEMNQIIDNIDALASGYLLPSGSANSLSDLKRKVYNLESKIDQRVYIQADQVQVLE